MDSKKNDPTKIMVCTCDHQGQDAIYGGHMRLHNWGTKKSVWRCTVCGREK